MVGGSGSFGEVKSTLGNAAEEEAKRGVHDLRVQTVTQLPVRFVGSRSWALLRTTRRSFKTLSITSLNVHRMFGL